MNADFLSYVILFLEILTFPRVYKIIILVKNITYMFLNRMVFWIWRDIIYYSNVQKNVNEQNIKMPVAAWRSTIRRLQVILANQRAVTVR